MQQTPRPQRSVSQPPPLYVDLTEADRGHGCRISASGGEERSSAQAPEWSAWIAALGDEHVIYDGEWMHQRGRIAAAGVKIPCPLGHDVTATVASAAYIPPLTTHYSPKFYIPLQLVSHNVCPRQPFRLLRDHHLCDSDAACTTARCFMRRPGRRLDGLPVI